MSSGAAPRYVNVNSCVPREVHTRTECRLRKPSSDHLASWAALALAAGRDWVEERRGRTAKPRLAGTSRWARTTRCSALGPRASTWR